MSHQIPTSEPTSVRAGDRLQWTKSLSDYPATEGWGLTYHLRSTAVDGHIQITGTASGGDHAVDVAAATTAGWTAGDYWWEAFVADGTSRYCVGSGSIEILPDFATIYEGYDGRSHNRQVLDALRATMLRAASRPEVSYSISAAGQSFSFRTLAELQDAIHVYESRVAQEEADARVALGGSYGNQVKCEFTTA